MIEVISDMPDHVIGITAKGKVTGADYESVIIPLVEEKLRRHRRITLYYYMGHEFSGIDAEAMWEDTKVGFRHLIAWKKIAVVSDIDWIRWAIKIFRVAIPGRVRVFANDQLAEAREWVSE